MKNLNKKQIIKLTRITEPFLMVDNIKNILNRKSAMGIKKIEKDSWFFKCHFIDEPMMPGTLIEEAMLQTIVSTLYSDKKFKNKICLITGTKTSFFSKVNKPTNLYIDIKILKITKLKVETTAIVRNDKKIKIASGIYNYFISKKLP
jgi:3-hydroxyacyl-[acyl-carrier-protein] dehydratase|tara:strand:+ start:804 stop:1244 length:441 start_codon:yes stop_codon:yes gene_type:complete